MVAIKVSLMEYVKYPDLDMVVGIFSALLVFNFMASFGHERLRISGCPCKGMISLVFEKKDTASISSHSTDLNTRATHKNTCKKIHSIHICIHICIYLNT